MSTQINAPILMRLRSRWFEAIKNGQKDVEGRIDRDKFSTLRPGDLITFRKEGGELLEATVVALHRAASFRELYEKFGDRLLPKSCLASEEISEPWTVYDHILDYAQAIQDGKFALGIEIKVG